MQLVCLHRPYQIIAFGEPDTESVAVPLLEGCGKIDALQLLKAVGEH